MFNHRMFLANIRDTYLEVSWGDSSLSWSLGLGPTIGMSYYSASINAATMPCVVSSRTEDALLVPDCSRNLASVPRFSQQGHDVRMNEEHPGLLLRDTKIFVPFCFEAHTGYYLMPWYPPPAYASFVRLPDKLDVIDLNASVESGAYVSRLSAAAHTGTASLDAVSESDSSSSLESSDSSSRASDVRLTRSSSANSSTSSSSTNSNDMLPVANRPAVKKRGKTTMKTSQKCNLTSSAKRRLGSAPDPKSAVPSGKLPTVHRIDSTHSLRKALVTAHERYGHVSPKKLVYFKKKGRVHSTTIPVRGALDLTK